MKTPPALKLASALLALPILTASAAPAALVKSVPAVNALPPGGTAAGQLKEALFAEEARADSGEASKIYQAIIEEAAAQQNIAATAAFRLGEIARKQGRSGEAQAHYIIALVNFRLDGPAADLCRQQLQALGGDTALRNAANRPLNTPAPALPANLQPEAQWSTLPPLMPRPGKVVKLVIPENPSSIPPDRLNKLKKQFADSPATPFTVKDMAEAAGAGDLAAMNFLIERGVDPNGTTGDPHFIAPLFTAAAYNQRAAVDLLLDKGAKLTKRCPRDTTALHSAAWEGVVEMIRHLAMKGADVNAMALGLQETRGVRLPIGTPLHAIGLQGVTAAGQALIDAGAEVNAACPESGHTPLHMAARFDRYDFARLLLEKGAKVDARYTGTHLAGTTPMHEAAAFGCTQTGIILADWKASLNTLLSAERPVTPVHLAIRGNHLGFLRGVVSRPIMSNGVAILPERPDYTAADELGDTALHIAARAGSETSVEFIRWLIAEGAPLDAKNKAGLTPAELAASPKGRQDPDISAALRPTASATVMSEAESHRCTQILRELPSTDSTARVALLHEICTEGHRAAAALLLDTGVPMNATVDQARTPLMSAAAAGHANVMLLLLDRGASINATDEAGRTALHYAAQEQKLESVRTLLDRGALVNANAAGATQDRVMWTAIGTPLTIAARWGNREICQLLLARGADVNFSPPESGQTPLIAAARHGRTDAVKLFLEAGANVNATWSPKAGPEAGSTALHNAAWFNCGDSVKLLLKAGADLNHRKLPGSNQSTPFMLLIRENHFELAHQLCTGTADQPAPANPELTLTDAEGDTALHVAVRSWSKASPEFISWLITRGAPLDVRNKTGLTPAELAADPKLGRPQPEILNAFTTTAITIEANPVEKK